MLRRLFLLTPAGMWGWRWHMLARHECANGPVVALWLQGELWKLTERERELVDEIAQKFRALEPQSMQQRLPETL